jgi:hypothetical protein
MLMHGERMAIAYKPLLHDEFTRNVAIPPPLFLTVDDHQGVLPSRLEKRGNS